MTDALLQELKDEVTQYAKRVNTREKAELAMASDFPTFLGKINANLFAYRVNKRTGGKITTAVPPLFYTWAKDIEDNLSRTLFK